MAPPSTSAFVLQVLLERTCLFRCKERWRMCVGHVCCCVPSCNLHPRVSHCYQCDLPQTHPDNSCLVLLCSGSRSVRLAGVEDVKSFSFFSLNNCQHIQISTAALSFISGSPGVCSSSSSILSWCCGINQFCHRDCGSRHWKTGFSSLVLSGTHDSCFPAPAVSCSFLLHPHLFCMQNQARTDSGTKGEASS